MLADIGSRGTLICFQKRLRKLWVGRRRDKPMANKDAWETKHFVVPCPECKRQMSYLPSEGYAWRCHNKKCSLAAVPSQAAPCTLCGGAMKPSFVCEKCGSTPACVPSRAASPYWPPSAELRKKVDDQRAEITGLHQKIFHLEQALLAGAGVASQEAPTTPTQEKLGR